jgi:hypothetical protein
MRFEGFSFGSIRIDGVSYDHDVVIDRGEIRKRKKKASKSFRDAFGPTLIVGGGHTVEVPPPGGRHRQRRLAGHEGGANRG